MIYQFHIGNLSHIHHLSFHTQFNTNKATNSAQLLLTKFEAANKMIKRRRRRRTMRCLKSTHSQQASTRTETRQRATEARRALTEHLFEETKLVDTMNGEEKI